MTFINDAQAILRKQGYKVMIAISNENPEQERENILMMEQLRVDGILMSSRVLSLSRTAMAMAETVNIPSLPHGAMWRRSSETTAGRRKSPLKGVGVDRGRQIHRES